MPINIYGKQIFCGYARGNRNIIYVPCTASAVFKALSAKFVTIDSNNDAIIATENETTLFGWAEVGEFTSQSTNGLDIIPVDISMDACYWIPADATVSEAVRAETCDIAAVSSNIVQADIGESNQDCLLIVDIDIANQMVMVKIADGKQQARGVA